MCHELDLVQHLLGPVVSVAGEARRVSDLEIDVDDSVMLVCRTRTGVSALVELDYLDPEPKRAGVFLGSGGRLDYSFRPPHARFVGRQGEAVEVFSAPEYSIDQMYRAQMEDFLEFVRTGRTRACTYAEGLDVMRMIAAAERLGAGEDVTR
jgi:predicted dehydrogenase